MPRPPTSPPAWSDKMQQFQKKWAEAVTETLGRQREALEAFSQGLVSRDSDRAGANEAAPPQREASVVR